jgi:protein SSD1
MMEQLAIQQQIELLQQQQQQIAATHQQYVNMGLLQPQQLGQVGAFSPGGSMGGVSPQVNAFQFPQQQQQQQLGVPMNAPNQHSHRRNQSALPGLAMGPPPAPSSGASGYADYNQQGQNQHKNENTNHGRGRGGPPGGGGHQRRHSLALPEAKKAAELAQQKRTASGFQFPAPASGSENQSVSDDKPGSSTSPAPQGLGLQRAGNIRAGGHGRSQSMAIGGNRGSLSGRGAGGFQFPAPSDGQPDNQRRGSQAGGHARTGSRNFDGNWRQPNNQNQGQDQQKSFGGQQQQGGGFQPGHRSRASMNQSMGSIGQFQYPGQPQLIQLPQGQVMMAAPQMFAGGQAQLTPLQLAQLQALQQQNGQGMGGLQASQHAPPQLSIQQQQQQQQQQRKTLFTPYLPQANLPALISNGQLVAGVLRVNKKNRSDAYVTTPDLDADIFICGSKDRNRALEGDFVAIELLDVDEVWNQKKEKEEKKKRKDITDARSNSNAGNDKLGRSDSNGDRQEIGPDGSIRRRGSLRQRPTQKKNDDVEVEGQSLLLVEEDEISDEQKPLYAGHVVAVIERIAGQMFSGTLGLLRPSSQATKEKQEAERQARDGAHGRHQDRHQEKPKIVWFKPTDKRVPLIAIPTEQAPRDFVEKHQDYANRIFVASIKRWPITSLHPFGTLVEQLGEMGDLRVETDALLRDNNFGSDEFSDAVIKSIGWEDWSVAKEGDALASRRDFREETTFTIDPEESKALEDAFHVKKLADGNVEIGVHVADIAHFVKGNSLVDREAKKRGTAVYLVDRVMNMLPPRVSTELCSLVPGEDRLTVSVVFKANPETGAIDDDVWIGKGVVKSAGRLGYDEVNAVLTGKGTSTAAGITADNLQLLNSVANKFRDARFGNRAANVPSLRLLQQLDDENVPVEYNIFDSTPAHELVEELSRQANFYVARKLVGAMPEKAFLRRQPSPNPRRLTLFVERMNRLGYNIDSSSSGSLQSSLCKVEDVELRKGMETLLSKAMQRAKYFVGTGAADEQRQHYTFNVPVYTHFTNPSRRYADVIVHRQLEAILSDGAIEFTDDAESLSKTADLCNNKKDSALNAQEQSVHIEACRKMDRKVHEIGGDLISEGIVLCVYESAFDVLIPEFGFEKRVHCDQLPLKKAEYRKDSRVLELYWEKGVPSSAYIPEDERPKPGNSRAAQAAAAAREAEAAKERARERDEAMRKQTETGTMSADDVDALFDDDEDVDEVTEMAAGVSLNSADRSTQSMPPSPTRNGHHPQGPHRTRSDPKIASSTSDAPENKMTNKEKYLKLFKLREEDGEFIQDVTEMTRVPIILKTDLSKSPPCLTVRSVNPYAL